MLQNHFKLAFRNLQKRLSFSMLNLAGLALGMAACLAILQYVLHEKSYDRAPSRAADIVRLRLDAYRKGEFAWKSATVYPAFAPTMLREFPELDATCRLHDTEMIFQNPDNQRRFSEKKGYFADPSFLEVFELPLVAGRAAEALSQPNQLVVSQTFAKKYFGTTEVLGRILESSMGGRQQRMAITGIFEKFPDNSHLIVEYLVSMPTLAQIAAMQGDTSRPLETSFGWYDFYTYLRLSEGTDTAAFAKKLPAFADKYINNQPRRVTAQARDVVWLQPLTSIHLNSNLNQEAEPNGSGSTVHLLFIVALFILGIAWINYLNLSTARAAERAREVGVRKVAGATRGQLVGQFMAESFLLNGAALLLAVGLVWLAQPFFAQIFDKKIPLSVLWSGSLGWMLAVFVAGTVASGFYPAMILSGFRPVNILKGAFKTSSQGVVLRKSLIVGQFAVSVAMLVGLVVVSRQVNFMRQQNPGFDRAQTLVLGQAMSQPDSVFVGALASFKNEILKTRGISSATATSSVPGEEIYWTNSFRKMNAAADQSTTLYILGMDADFSKTYDLKMVAGRSFEPTDRPGKAILLNETSARLLGFDSPEAALNQQVMRGNRDTLTVRGVVKDFNHQGLQKAVDPMCLRFSNDYRNHFSLKIEAGSDLAATIAEAETVWKKHFPADPFDYFFLDEFFDRQYRSDVQFGRVFGLFTGLAIFIACLGLFGLASYTVLQRTKEIGIRKVLGATTAGITSLLARDFLKLVAVAILVASPLAWYFLKNWLSDFAYRIEMEWWMFALAGAVAVGIASLTVGFQSVRAALANPVQSLRSE